MGYQREDRGLRVTQAMPNGVATVTSSGLDLGHGSRGDFLANAELEISAPVLTTVQLPDTKVVVYDVEHDDDPAFGGATVAVKQVLLQTGAAGAGAAAATGRCRLPVDVKRYVRVKAAKDGTGDASAKTFTVDLLT